VRSINILKNMVNKYELQEKLKTVIADYLKGENILLVDLNLRPQGKKLILRILVDEPGGGITIDRCTYLNNAISQLLDAENLIQGSYILEVSSPGIDRPLLTREDFSRCLNRRVRIFFNQCQDGRYEILGVITSVTGTGLDLDSGGKIQHIAFDQIRKSKQVI
jgi:ribosome maturation factor RimP